MFKRPAHEEHESPQSPVVEVLQRLWQTKLSSIALLEKWRTETSDTEIKAGLGSQLVDERRHATMIGEQIRRLGGRIGPSHKDGVTRVFEDAHATSEDLTRLFTFYRGVKAYTVDRCVHLIPHVDAALAQVLDRLTLDEERHIRWADLRLERLLTHERMRECNLLMTKVWISLEAGWERQWRYFSRLPLRRPGQHGPAA